jgi:hypothetical protein
MIDSTGATDVSEELSTYISESEERIIHIQPGTYRVDFGVEWRHGDHQVLDLVGVDFIQDTKYAKRNRYGAPILSILDCNEVSVEFGRLRGGNWKWLSGLRRWSVFALLSALMNPLAKITHAGWVGIRIGRSRGVWIHHTKVECTESDFVMIGDECENIVLEGIDGDTSGRHGVSWRGVDGLQIKDCNLRKIKRIRYDHEPLPGEGCTNVSIVRDRGESGRILHGYLQLMAGPQTRLSNIEVRDAWLTKGHFKTYVRPAIQRDSFIMTNMYTEDPCNAGLAPGEKLIDLGAVYGFNHAEVRGIHDHLPQGAIDNQRVIDFGASVTRIIDVSGVTPGI